MVTDAHTSAVDTFQTHRRYLTAVAYRLLGSLTDAEDVLQEAWLRWQAVDPVDVRAPRAFLTTVVTRLCYDELGSARARRESYFGEWLPEPLFTEQHAPTGSPGPAAPAVPENPADLAERGEDVSLAMLAVMEQLSPAERIAFVLHDVFSIGFEEIGASLGRSATATRQLASRGRRRVRGAGAADEGGTEGRSTAARTRAEADEHRAVVRAFAEATATGDIPGLLSVLAPDVVWRSDGGGVVKAGVRPVRGAQKVMRLLDGLAQRYLAREDVTFEVAEVNGEPGLVGRTREGTVMSVVAFVVENGRLVEALTVLNPAKLRHLD